MARGLAPPDLKVFAAAVAGGQELFAADVAFEAIRRHSGLELYAGRGLG